MPLIEGMPWQWPQAEQLARQAASTQSACTTSPPAAEESAVAWEWAASSGAPAWPPWS